MVSEDTRSLIAIAIQASFLLVIILSSLMGNTLILLAIYRNHSLRCITSFFIANLAMADFLLALLGMPFTMASSITYHWIFGDIWCKINGMLNSIFCIASMLSLAAVSIDRYVAIIKPLQYPLIMTPPVALGMVTYVWLHAIICAFLPVFGWSNYAYITNESICTADWGKNFSYTLFIFAFSFFTPLIIMAYCYFHILRAAKKQSKKISPRVGEIREETLQTIVAVPVPAVTSEKADKEKEAKEKFRRETRAAKTLLIVMGTFLFCWAPHFIGMTCLLFEECKRSWPDEYFATTTWLAMLNSGCNPIIYGVMNKKFRQSFKDIIMCTKRTNRQYGQREAGRNS
ncbi:octopamine receptor beta-2R-like [Acropora palmata]|uniref:octopamine receptor beta-2R-like n=1 Tax=Acropora palmata TaxID=6131 RepID=UPI003DA08A59